MHRVLHVLAHVGLTTLAVAAIVGPLAPPPFGLAIGGGAIAAQAFIAWRVPKTGAKPK